ncbi:MAG TPA: PTS sugar transporter subunit IIC [Nitrospirota bacterium]|nr:PTS sugar transporter subunit IIC [Nitrospirota bacterium]
MPLFDLHAVALILLAAAAGGLIGLDRTAAGQVMISQPIVAGPVTGWLLGDPSAGFVIGALLELIWVLDMPVGNFVPADITVGTVSATAIAVIGSGGQAPLDLIGFSILLTTGMAPVSMITDQFIRKSNAALAESARAGADEDPACALSRSHIAGVAVFFLKSFVLVLLFVPAGLAAAVVFRHVPAPAHAAMALFVKVLPLLGAAVVLNRLSIAVLDRFLVTGFAAAAALTTVLGGRPLVIILLVLAAGLAGAAYRERRS